MNCFTFGVLAYNQEHYILETLESIKYQKINYGENIDVKLIIVDDNSSDRTIQVVSLWIEKNKSLFSTVEFIINQSNQGTVFNFCTILHHTQGEHFKVIAGDDLIGSRNLFLEYLDLDDKKLKTYFRVELIGDKIYYREKYLIDFYYHKMHNHEKGYNIKHIRKGRYLHTPSTIFTKDLFVNSKCEELLKEFHLYEDEPTWYSMMKNKKDLSVEFADGGIVLYRMHEQSVSNAPNMQFQKELKHLRSIYYKDTKGLEHIYLAIKIASLGLPYYINPAQYIDKIINIMRKRICLKDKNYQVFKEKIEQQIQDEQRFYDMIKNSIKEVGIEV